VRWYCPKCGQEVVEKDGIWACTSGGLEFSMRVGGQLAATYGASFLPGRKPAAPMQVGVLFCPSCCAVLGREYVCPECHRSLRQFIFQLIEIHPHADGNGKYR
jgi:hypothetical protein